MHLIEALTRANAESPKLKPDERKALRQLLKRMEKSPFKKVGKLRLNRVQLAQDAVQNALQTSGHDAALLAATDRYGAIDWEKLLELLIKYLPQILAILLQFFK